MNTLSAADLLMVWERGQMETPGRRALLLLSAAHPELPPEEIPRWSIAERDTALLRLRERLFGADLKSLANCPGCGEPVEFALNSHELLRETASAEAAAPASPHRASWQDWEAHYRLPNSLDLEAQPAGASLAENERHLLAGCISALHQGGRPVSVEQLPAELAAVIAQGMADAAPVSQLELLLECPACARGWTALLDATSYLWTELHSWAAGLLGEVHALALAYGWSERDILALSSRRRRHYLDLLGL